MSILGIILTLAISASLFVPSSASAGVLSFISSLFSPVDAMSEDVVSSSHDLPLLQAVNSPEPTLSKKDIAIVSGVALSPETFVPAPVKTADDDLISMYVVHKDDTLQGIADMFNVSANTIRWGNNLKGNTITIGQTLVILPISGVSHTVKKGDTIQSIAKLYKGDIDEIVQYNNLTKGSALAVGDVIVIPDGEMSVSSSGGSSSSVKSSTSYPIYDGYYMRPIVGGVKTQGIHGHNGVDLASHYGADILASAEGDVIISRDSGWNGGYGSYIVLKHGNGTQTLYAHLSATVVSVGDHVSQGQVIGKMGNTGDVNGPTGVHLHFEIRGARNPF